MLHLQIMKVFMQVLEDSAQTRKWQEDCSMGCVCVCSVWFGLTDYM